MNPRALVAIALATASCQTRTQALIVTVGATGIGLGAGYFEYETRSDNSGPPYSLIVGGAVAAISAISMLFLHDRRHTEEDNTPASEWEPSNHRDKGELMTALRRTACMDHCPQYTITIYRDGVVEYNGIADVAKIGSAVSRLSVRQLEALEAFFVPAYEAFEPSYTNVHCTDLPTAYTWYRPSGGPTKAVTHYLGDADAPPKLLDIERAIDAAVQIQRWIGTNAPFRRDICARPSH